jgi:hypothetical protein
METLMGRNRRERIDAFPTETSGFSNRLEI